MSARPDRLIPDPELCHLLGDISRQTLWRYRRAGIVPQRVTIGPEGSLIGGTPASEIAAVLEARKAARDARIAGRDQEASLGKQKLEGTNADGGT